MVCSWLSLVAIELSSIFTIKIFELPYRKQSETRNWAAYKGENWSRKWKTSTQWQVSISAISRISAVGNHQEQRPRLWNRCSFTTITLSGYLIYFWSMLLKGVTFMSKGGLKRSEHQWQQETNCSWFALSGIGWKGPSINTWQMKY